MLGLKIIKKKVYMEQLELIEYLTEKVRRLETKIPKRDSKGRFTSKKK